MLLVQWQSPALVYSSLQLSTFFVDNMVINRKLASNHGSKLKLIKL
jgi:hypothetical protein